LGSSHNRVDLVHESMELVNPVSKVFFIIYNGVFILKGVTQKSIGSMVGTCNVDKGEMGCENGHNSVIDAHTGGNVRI
jgi:hypothetical protein